MKLKIILIIAIVELSIFPAAAQTSLAQKLSGRILLQVEARGEAWYVNPTDQKRYFLGRPNDAFNLMQRLALGTSNANLNKIPLGILDYSGTDDDGDGLPNNLERIIGTDPIKVDSDNDGYGDRAEIINNYNPMGSGQIAIDKNLAKQLSGRILLQTETFGAGWFLNPADHKKYYLGRPADAWEVMRRLALGITDENLAQITISQLELATTTPVAPPQNPPQTPPQEQSSVIEQAANAIRAKNKNLTSSYFIPGMKKRVEYAVENMSAESLLILGNILSGSRLTNSTNSEKIYSNEVYFSLGGYEVPLSFRVQKQPDGEWLMTNL